MTFKPPTRLNTSRGPDLTIRYEIEKPNWGRWQKLDHIQLWQAACLLVDIDPPTPSDGDIWATYQLRGLPSEFHEVWEIINADSYFSTLEVIQYSGRMLWKVHLAGFAKWACDKGLKPPVGLTSILDSSVTMKAAAPSAIVESGLSKREQQIRAIEGVIEQLNYSAKSIPDGGKTKIGKECSNAHSSLFGAGKDPFLDAWKEAVKQGRVRMANHDQYKKK